MDPRRTFGSNCASMGGRVVRLEEGGGVSINMGVGPEFIADGFGVASYVGCPSHTMSVHSQSTHRRLLSEKKALSVEQSKQGLREWMVGVG
jgi:hypothetical protein